MNYINFINERRSIRNFDPSVKIERNVLESILSLAGRAPSSGNLQPWRFIVVETDEGKETLRKVMFGNLKQLETSSAMIIVFYDNNEYDYVEKIYKKAVNENLMPKDVAERQITNLEKMGDMIDEWHQHRDGFVNVGIVIAQLVYAARAHGYDSGVMRGFIEEKMAEAFNLPKHRYLPAAIVAIGKKADDGFDSVRLDLEDIVTYK